MVGEKGKGNLSDFGIEKHWNDELKKIYGVHPATASLIPQPSRND